MRFSRLGLLLALAILIPGLSTAEDAPAKKLSLTARLRIKGDGAAKHDTVQLQTLQWDPKQTAIVVCDMWDKHWCPTATERVGEMAPRMNEVLKAARSQGVFIIHCPSDTLEFYKDTPQRKLAQQAPVVATKVPLERWIRILP